MGTLTDVDEFIADLCRCDSRQVILVAGPTWPEVRKRCVRNLQHTGWHLWVESPAVSTGEPMVVMWNDEDEVMKYDAVRCDLD